jgi:ABC-type transport system involved in cytochrome c biogenesis permease subunit
LERQLIIDILNIALPVLYFTLVWVYGKAFFADFDWAKQLKSKLLLAIIVIHLLYLIDRTIVFNHPPVTTVFEILTVLAFSVAVAYAFIERRSNAKETGYFILNIAFFFQLASSLFIKDLVEVPEVLRSPLFGLHVSSALLGYAAITISAVYGFLYLMLYHQIKASKFGVIYKKLPNLETLERMSSIAIALAFGLLTVAIVFGFIWLPKAFDDFSYLDPKLIGTLIVWGLYGIGVFARRRGVLTGRKIMLLSILGFAITIFSMTVVNMFFSGFHKFH